MRVALVNTDYVRFLSWLYRRYPQLIHCSYEEQMRARNASLFGTADFYSQGFKALGHEAIDIHANNDYLQGAWAREQGFPSLADQLLSRDLLTSKSSPKVSALRKLAAPLRPYLKPLAHRLGMASALSDPQASVLRHQLEMFRPDIIFIKDVYYVPKAFLRSIKATTGARLVGWLGKPLLGSELQDYDLAITQLRSVTDKLNRRGGRAIQSALAFGNSVLDTLPSNVPRDIDVSFVGTISEEHQHRIELLEAVARRFELRLFGSGVDFLSRNSPLRRCWAGELWGRDMYMVLARSKITINSYLDKQLKEAGNMRLYEATGVRTFLLTPWRETLHELFEPERHVGIWRTKEECVERIGHYLDRHEERELIASSGQQHTLSRHTYAHRARELSEHFERMIG